MRDDFVGDIGDFGKYALLIALAGSDFTLLVNWYFNNQRGRAFQYLHQEKKYGDCFPRLYSALQEMAKDVPGRLKEIESRRILPEKTLFFAEPLDVLAELQPHAQHRMKWHSQALEKSKRRISFSLILTMGLSPRETHEILRGPQSTPWPQQK